MSASESEAQKDAWLQRRLEPWRDTLTPVHAVSDTQRWGYRDRVSLSACWQGRRWLFGVMRRDELIPIHDCPVHSARVRCVVNLLSRALPGEEHFALAYLVQSGAQTVLVLKQRDLPATDWLDETLQTQLAACGVEGFWLHCFPAAGRNLFAKNGWHLLWGEPRSRDAEGYLYRPGAFSQLLPELHAQSLDEAQAFLEPRSGDRVVDLYCGRGLSLVRWLGRGAETIGVELSGEALACAEINAPQAELLRGGCAQRLPQLATWWQGVPLEQRLAYLNPPRTGLEPEVAQWLVHQGRPARIAYLSCSTGTLARDLGQLEQGGYRVERITPYDFFPQTYHVETLALLSR